VVKVSSTIARCLSKVQHYSGKVISIVLRLLPYRSTPVTPCALYSSITVLSFSFGLSSFHLGFPVKMAEVLNGTTSVAAAGAPEGRLLNKPTQPSDHGSNVDFF